MITQRLREARKAAGYASAEKAARVMGISASTYRAHENGQNDISVTAAAKYASFFGVSASYLMAGEGSAVSESETAPVPELSAATRRQRFVRESSPLDGLGIIRFWHLPAPLFNEEFGTAAMDMVVVRMPGDNMSPTHMPGDRLLVDVSKDTFHADGVYVLAEGGNISVYRIQAVPGTSGEGRAVSLTSDNNSYPAHTVRLSEITIAGRVRGSISVR